MTNKILMGVSVLALLTALPAFAETKVDANADVSTSTKIENKLDKAGESIKEGADRAETATREAYQDAKAKTKETYGDVKAYFSDDDDVKAVTSINIDSRLTADELLGADVQNPSGEKIGSIEDILVDQEGGAETVVINDGGVLGLGGKLVAFDYDIIEGVSADKDVIVKLTDASIKKAKRFEYKAPSKPDAAISVMPASQFSVKKVQDAKVVDANGKAVANVSDVVFEGDEADYLIVTFDKFLGLGGDKAALDFEALDVANNNGKYTFKLTSQQTAQFENQKATTKAN
ncbi:MAG TPA: PRC-barrel domain-containing protein [Micavibrio sp.]|nr:PRC-barrel domain-containing protein [Micavibrio sp.]